MGSTGTSGNDGSNDGITASLPSGSRPDQIIVTVTTSRRSSPPTPAGYTVVSLNTTTGCVYDPRIVPSTARQRHGGESSSLVNGLHLGARARPRSTGA